MAFHETPFWEWLIQIIVGTIGPIRVKFSNFYLLIGWRIKSYFANSENFWPFGLVAFIKAKKGQKMKFWHMNQNSLIHGEN